MTPQEVAQTAFVAADDKQADDIFVYDVRNISDFCDYLLVCSADNPNKILSIIKEVEEKVFVNCATKPLHVEGLSEKQWILLDFGSVIVNVLSKEAREYYQLESLWADAPLVSFVLEQ